MMNSIVQIKAAIQQLPAQQLAELREWFAHFDAAQWDRQLVRDVAAGRLDDLADNAIREITKSAENRRFPK